MIENLTSLLKASSNEEVPLKPKFKAYLIGYPDVFFVNITKNFIIFF